jgi:chromosome segregation ATPase
MSQHLNQQSHELSAMQKHITTIMKERDFLANESTRHAEEARNLGSDLTAVSRENQALNSELVHVAGERDRFKSELTECERQIQYLDELCRVKDQEKDHHTLSYRKLIADHEKLNIAQESSRQECDGLRYFFHLN